MRTVKRNSVQVLYSVGTGASKQSPDGIVRTIPYGGQLATNRLAEALLNFDCYRTVQYVQVPTVQCISKPRHTKNTNTFLGRPFLELQHY